MKRNCPKCDEEMEHQEQEDDVGIIGCWFCTKCDITIEEEAPQED